ncbi:MAG: hypothetical protein GY854_07550 [Deltaproteobacteria bacterium]|nr:hypothetical protein [Deltaproteobacteria bacterium]
MAERAAHFVDEVFPMVPVRQWVLSLLRYILRPPIADSRLKELPSGQILLKLKNRWRDGTMSIVFEPIEFLEKVAALIPRPHVNQIIYHGALGAKYKQRKKVVGYGRPPEEVNSEGEGLGDPDNLRYIDWAELMRRTFGVDVLACEKCAGRMEIIALIDQPPVIKKILRHLGLPTEIPQARLARPPPVEEEFDDSVQLALYLDEFDGVDDPTVFAE